MQSKDLGKFSTNFKDKQVKGGYKGQNQEKAPIARLIEIAGSWLFPLLNKCFADDRNTMSDASIPYFGNQTIFPGNFRKPASSRDRVHSFAK